jgi:hypothetical protein
VTVTSLDDRSLNSLRSAIDSANSGDTIVFGTGLSGQITLDGGLPYLGGGSELEIDKNLDIEGPGASQLAIAGYDSRVFEVTADAHVTLAGLTIEHGNGYMGGSLPDVHDRFGGGVLNFGTLTVRDCTLTGNSASYGGGGIYNAGTLTITDSTLTGNSASYGGAIANLGTLAVSGSIFSGNSASSGGGIYNTVHDIGIKGLGSLAVNSCMFSGNSATYGGGLYNYYQGMASVTGCTFSGDSASHGAGIYVFSSSKLTVSNSTFSDNNPDNIFGHFTDKGGNTFS